MATSAHFFVTLDVINYNYNIFIIVRFGLVQASLDSSESPRFFMISEQAVIENDVLRKEG